MNTVSDGMKKLDVSLSRRPEDYWDGRYSENDRNTAPTEDRVYIPFRAVGMITGRWSWLKTSCPR